MKIVITILFLAVTAFAQISGADAQRIRELEARAISAERTVEIQQAHITELLVSRQEWKDLFVAERVRADKQQEAIILYEKRITNFTDQHNADVARIDSLERRVGSLKFQRNVALLGNAVSFGGGYLLGQQSGNAPTIINNPPSSRMTIQF